MELKQYWTMDYSELDEKITEAYGLEEPYELVAYEELSNDSLWGGFAFNKELLDQWQEAEIWELRQTKKPKHYRTVTIMQDMVNNGLLPEGRFLVEVCW